MIMEIEGKQIELAFTTKNVMKTLNLLHCDDLNKAIYEGIEKTSSKTLAIIIYGLTQNDFKNTDEVYDFLDAYKTENNSTVGDIYKLLITAFNNHYFFMTKMTEDEVEKMITSPLSGKMDSIVEEAVRGSMAKMTEKTLIESQQ
jgi:hypothetical protein